MSGKGGADAYICGELRKVIEGDPSLSFDSAARKLFDSVYLDENRLSQLFLLSQGEGRFLNLRHRLAAGETVSVTSIRKALFVDICRIYAAEDSELAAKVAS